MAEKLLTASRGIDMQALDQTRTDELFNQIASQNQDLQVAGEVIAAETPARHGLEAPQAVAAADIIARVQRERQAEAALNLPADMPEEEQSQAERLALINAPQGFRSIEDAQKDETALGRGKLSLLEKARLAMGGPSRLMVRGYSRLMEYRARKSAEFDSLSADDKNRRLKKVTAIATLGAAAVLTAMVANKAGAALDVFDQPTGATGGSPDVAPDTAVDATAELPHDTTAFIYEPSRDVFNNPARQEFNFRAALDITSADTAAKDLAEGWKTNPLQFATALGAFGIIENNQASIEATAQQMLTSPDVFAANYDQVQAMIENSTASIQGPFEGGYGSYSMFSDQAGNQHLAFNNTVFDPQKILRLDTPTGPLFFGTKCGQSICLPGAVEATPAAAAPHGEGVLPAPTAPETGVVHTMTPAAPLSERPYGGGTIPNPTAAPAPPATSIPTPTVPYVPSTPTIPEVTIPSIPNTPNPEGPVVPLPKSKDYSGGVGTAPGLDPNTVKFIEDTTDFLTRGNGTDSSNLTPDVAPGAEESGYLADGAAANTAPQVATPETGAGTSRTEADQAAQAELGRAQAEQESANQAGRQMEAEMSRPGAVDSAVQDAIDQMDDSGRPSGTSSSSSSSAANSSNTTSSSPSVDSSN